MFDNSQWFLVIQNNTTNNLLLLDSYQYAQEIVLKPKHRKHAKELRTVRREKMDEIIKKHHERLLFFKKS